MSGPDWRRDEVERLRALLDEAKRSEAEAAIMVRLSEMQAGNAKQGAS